MKSVKCVKCVKCVKSDSVCDLRYILDFRLFGKWKVNTQLKGIALNVIHYTVTYKFPVPAQAQRDMNISFLCCSGTTVYSLKDNHMLLGNNQSYKLLLGNQSNNL